MARSQRSIRFSDDEWDVVVPASERNDVTPGAFVRETAPHAAAENFDLSDTRLPPEPIEDRPADVGVRGVVDDVDARAATGCRMLR